MSINFERGAILQGAKKLRDFKQSPTSIGMVGGSPQASRNRDLDVKYNERMAGGEQGQRALALLNNPEELERAKSYQHMLNSFPDKNIPYNA